MKFSRFAYYLERVESTSKRLEMFDILSEMFKEADKNEVDKMVYFCEEQLLPAWQGLETGMADKMAAKAIAKASGKNEKDILDSYKKLGDLGLVVEKFSGKQSTLFNKKSLSVSEVYDELIKLAKTSGEGSVDRKVGMLSGLLSNMNSKEMKYAVRFILGRLRLGIGDPTIMDSISKALTGDRMQLRKDIERAFNMNSDLGYVAKVLFDKGERGLKEFKVIVGKPIRMALAERLPNAEDIIKKIGKCAVETKYDGLRLAIHKNSDKIEIFSRNQERMTKMFPDVIEAVKKQIAVKDAILEGEAVAYNEETGEFFPFQTTMTRKRKYGVAELAKEMPVVVFAFDLLYDGRDLTKDSFADRRKKLKEIVKKGFVIRLSDQIITDDPKEMEKFFEENIEKGTEGIIAKRLDSEYQAGARNFNWIKLKRSYKGELQDTIDVVIIGYMKGRGMRAKF
jgi:DNA ligase-1